EGRSSRARHAAEARNCTVRADPPTLPYLSAGQSLAPLQGGLLASRSMTAPRSLAVVLICAGFVLAGGAAELVFLPRHLTVPEIQLHGRAKAQLSQPEMEALLAKVAKSLDPSLRTKLAEAVLTESARAGYD